MQPVEMSEAARLVAAQIAHGGVFLTSADGERQNVMTIGWGGVNCFYNKGVFIAPVRKSRFTYELLERGGSYVVSVPLHPMKEQLSFVGTQSGRDIDKLVGHGLTAVKATQVDAPCIGECELQLECRIIGQTELTQLNDAVLDRWYADRDMHTLFLGEIVACYRTR